MLTAVIHARRAYVRETIMNEYINMTLCNRELPAYLTTVVGDNVTCKHCLKQLDLNEDAEAQEFKRERK